VKIQSLEKKNNLQNFFFDSPSTLIGSFIKKSGYKKKKHKKSAIWPLCKKNINAHFFFFFLV